MIKLKRIKITLTFTKKGTANLLVDELHTDFKEVVTGICMAEWVVSRSMVISTGIGLGD